jgi:hypothetical protein
VEASKIYIILAFFISGNIESMVKIDIQFNVLFPSLFSPKGST